MSDLPQRPSLERVKHDARNVGLVAGALLLVVLIPIQSVALRMLQGFALLALGIATFLFVLNASTAGSMILKGRRREQFQVAIAVGFPVLLSLYFLLEATDITFEAIVAPLLSPWQLVPIAAYAFVSWHLADHLDRDHPVRGFLIASAVVFVLCFMWHHGTRFESDDDGGGFHYIDKDEAREAAKTGRYSGRFLMDIAVVYSAMLARIKWRRSKWGREAAIRDVNMKLTEEVVEDIVARMAGHVANGQGRYRTESDLPLPRPLIEFAFVKALLTWPEGERLERLKTLYIILDDYMLSAEDCVVLNRYHEFLTSASWRKLDGKELAEAATEAGCSPATALMQRLNDQMHRRSEMMDGILAGRPPSSTT